MPLQANIAQQAIGGIVKETGARCLFCSAAELPLICSAVEDCPSVSAVVCMDLLDAEAECRIGQV